MDKLLILALLFYLVLCHFSSTLLRERSRSRTFTVGKGFCFSSGKDTEDTQWTEEVFFLVKKKMFTMDTMSTSDKHGCMSRGNT